MRFTIVGYELTSALGRKIRKLVVCKTEDEYNETVRRIEDAGLEVIIYDEIILAEQVLRGGRK